jgi:uncharacterized protein (TIGR04255 family)
MRIEFVGGLDYVAILRYRLAPRMAYAQPMSRTTLPEFENPPVSEVALSVQFSPLENWRSAHAGLYWGRINKNYPHTDTQPPLPSQIEKFGAEFWQRPMVRVEFANPDIGRSWFISDPPTKLIQVQRDRFIINWRKVKGDETYPRYLHEMRPRFEREWREFATFVSDEKIGTVSVQQCEVTYVNELLQGRDWGTFQDSLALFAPWWKDGTDHYLPKPTSLALSGSVDFAPERGRLHFTVQHARRPDDEREIVQFTLLARGKPASGTDADILAWMDMGHEWIVRGFSDLTSTQAHQLWKRRS